MDTALNIKTHFSIRYANGFSSKTSPKHHSADGFIVLLECLF